MCREENVPIRTNSSNESTVANPSATNSDNSKSTSTASVSSPSLQSSSCDFEKGRALDGTIIYGSLRPKQSPEATTKIGILGSWYDITKFAKYHPGGDIIYEFNDLDATAQFLAYHDVKLLDKYKFKAVGTYEYNKDRPGGSKFQGTWMKLNTKFELEGKYQTPTWFLYSRVAILIGFCMGMSSMMYLYLHTYSKLSFIVGAACMAGIWQQSGFLMHDTMHNHIYHDRKRDQQLGYIFGNVILGVSGRWWRDEHNEHHVFTNTIVEGVGPSDPQMIEDVWIQNEMLIPYFVLQSTIKKLILDYQQYYFVPILVIVGLFPIKIDAITHTDKRYVSDILGLALHITWVGSVLWCLPTIKERILFYVIANCISGCLGIQLLVSHYAKPWIEKTTTKTDIGFWAKRQVEAVIDITCPRWLDWFHGGLHIHSVHHMFPRMCRCYYRDVYDEIIQMCNEHDVQLDQFSWLDAIGLCVKHFSTIKYKVDIDKGSFKAKRE